MGTDKALRTKILAVFTLALIFGAGFSMGLVMDRSLEATPAEDEPVEETKAERPEGRRSLIVDKVGLSLEQQEAIDSTVAEHGMRMRGIEDEWDRAREEFQARFRAVIVDTRLDIMSHLTEEQAAQYEVLLAEHDERRRKKREEREDREDRDREHPIP